MISTLSEKVIEMDGSGQKGLTVAVAFYNFMHRWKMIVIFRKNLNSLLIREMHDYQRLGHNLNEHDYFKDEAKSCAPKTTTSSSERICHLFCTDLSSREQKGHLFNPTSLIQHDVFNLPLASNVWCFRMKPFAVVCFLR